MEIRRFGPGHRRPEGPPGSRNVAGQVIHADARGSVAELALGTHAVISPHTNPNTAYFVVVSGGGFVQVGEERIRVGAGEAVVWPADVPHGVYTEGTELRALVVEFAGPDDGWARGVLEGRLVRRLGAGADPVEKGEGRLAERPPVAFEEHDRSSGEPW